MDNPELFTPAHHGLRTPRPLVANALQTPYVLVEHGLEALDQNVYTLGLFLEQTECRDKMFKVFQYACKAIALLIPRYFPLINSYKNIVERLHLIDNQTGICRKYLRSFAFLPLWRLAWMVAKSDDSKWLKIGALGRLLGLSGYFFFDNITLLVKLRILDGSTALITRISLAFQLGNQFCSLLVNLHHIRAVMLEAASIRKQLGGQTNEGSSSSSVFSFEDKETLRDQLVVLNKKYGDLQYQIVKNLLEGALAANIVFKLKMPELFAVSLDLCNAYLSMTEVFLRLRSKARAEKREKEKHAKKWGEVAELYSRGPHVKHLRERSMSFPAHFDRSRST